MNNVGLKNLVNEPRVREFAIDFTFCKEPTKLNLEEFAIELHFVGLAVVTKKKKKKLDLLKITEEPNHIRYISVYICSTKPNLLHQHPIQNKKPF